MADLKTRAWTYNLTSGSLSITKEMGLTQLSILLISGAGTVKGDLELPVANLASVAIALQQGQAITFSSSGNSPLDGITITWTSGTIQLAGN